MKRSYVVYFFAIQIILIFVLVTRHSNFHGVTIYPAAQILSNIDPESPEINVYLKTIHEKEDEPKLVADKNKNYDVTKLDFTEFEFGVKDSKNEGKIFGSTNFLRFPKYCFYFPTARFNASFDKL